MSTARDGERQTLDRMQALVDEFRARLDDTLILSILGDFDLDTQYEEAREILDSLAVDAPAEEATLVTFTATETETESELEIGGVPVARSTTTATTNTPEHPENRTDSTSRTDASDGVHDSLEAFEFQDDDDFDVSTLDDDGKRTRLKMMFPELTDLDIKLALNKSHGDFITTCEELLITQYLEEEGLRPKGIDGAFNNTPSTKKTRKRASSTKDKYNNNKVALRYNAIASSSETTSTPATRSPALAKLSLPVSSIASPTSSAPASPVFRASYPVPSNTPASKPDHQWHIVQTRLKTCSEYTVEAAAARQVSNHSRAAASEAYRRGKSDHHFRAVAGVLSARASEQARRARAAESLVYGAQVRERGSRNRIDLHGVPVAEGVQIAQDLTAAWYKNLGENRIRIAREEGFTIITGIGHHSANGVSQLRQQVPAALRRNGWTLRTETGQFVVTGKQ